MQPSDANPLIRPNRPSIFYGRRTTPPFRRPELPTQPCISGYLSLGRGTSRWTRDPSTPGAPSVHLHPMPASLPWVLQRPDSRSSKESPGLGLRRLLQNEWLHHSTHADYAVSTQSHLLFPKEHRIKHPSLLPLAPTYFDTLAAPFDWSTKHQVNCTYWTSACNDCKKVPRVQEMPSSSSKSSRLCIMPAVVPCDVCKGKPNWLCRDWGLQLHGLSISVHLCNQPAAVARITDMPEENKHRFTILQWNCDCLTTKVVELRELILRYGIDIIALQETKHGRDEPTPVHNGFDAVKKYGPGSGARSARGGGLLTYIKKGIPYSEVPAAKQGPLVKQLVNIPTTRRQHLTIVSAYFPPASSNYVQPMDDHQTWVDTLEARGASVICGDFNAHHVSWDEYAQGLPRGAELYKWVVDNEMAVLNDGKPTRAARFQ